MGKRQKVFLVCGVISIITTILLYLLLTSNRRLGSYVGIAAILFVEIMFFGGWSFIEGKINKDSAATLRMGCGGVISTYSSIMIIVSLVFIVINYHKVNVQLSIYLVLTALLIIIEIILYLCAFSTTRTVDTTLVVSDKVIKILDRLSVLAMDENNIKYQDNLNKLIEEMKNTNMAKTSQWDLEISKLISKLEMELINENEDKDVKVNSMLKDLLLLIHKRRIEINNR